MGAVRLPAGGHIRRRGRAHGGVLQRGAGLPVGAVPAAAQAGDVGPPRFGLDGPAETSCNGPLADGKRRACDVPPTWGEADMNVWWWVPVGLVAWSGVALAVGLLLGPGLMRSSQAREALGAQTGRHHLGAASRPMMGRAPLERIG
jgi:hypothetical protein